MHLQLILLQDAKDIAADALVAALRWTCADRRVPLDAVRHCNQAAAQLLRKETRDVLIENMRFVQ